MEKQKVAVVTGGAKGIGKAICDEFKRQGTAVCIIDLLDNDYYVGDITEEAVLRSFAVIKADLSPDKILQWMAV